MWYEYVFFGFIYVIPFLFLFWLITTHRKRNTVASLVITSNLRSIPEIARHAGISEDKVIKILRILTSGSSVIKLSNDAKYLKGAKINLQTMEITLSDKHLEKEPWTCAYCRVVNPPEVLTCQSCQAAKKKL